jgi:hypothetical protein
MDEEVNVKSSADGKYIFLNGVCIKRAWLNAYVDSIGKLEDNQQVSGVITVYNSTEDILENIEEKFVFQYPSKMKF